MEERENFLRVGSNYLFTYIRTYVLLVLNLLYLLDLQCKDKDK
jgi:hypothetical protein